MAGSSYGLRVIEQLLREWPPGYGGVERVAHELACVWAGKVYSLDAQRRCRVESDALPAPYPRSPLPCTPALGRLVLPLPSRALWQMLVSKSPLHGHLPSPGVLLLLLLARIGRPGRSVTVHWHCFLEPGTGLNAVLFGCYQWLALRLLPLFSGVVTTSPVLQAELVRSGCRPQRVSMLPCCLSAQQETAALALPRMFERCSSQRLFQVVFIGRLDSYKRLDWLLSALAGLALPWRLVVVGDGPRRQAFEDLSEQLFADSCRDRVCFRGRLDETSKLHVLASSDLLVLPSDRCNEGFGIVQLEAMAAGIPALAFDLPRSGMGWVGQLPSLHWPQTPEALPAVLQQLASDPSLCAQLGREARERYLKLFSRAVWFQRLQALDHDGRSERCGGNLAWL